MADPKARIVISAEDRTKGAFDSAKRNLLAIQASARGVVSALGPIAAVASAAAAGIAAINIKAAVNLADELGKLSQKSGVAVENLSALRFAGELADVSLDELSDGLKKLNINIAAAARGEKEQAEAFKLLGVAVKDAAGNVRSADEILGDVADRFAGYADGPNKSAIANAIFGRSFDKLIPLLNGGRKGLADARAELEKYGGVISGDLAKKSEQFNDNITRLGVAFESLKIKLAGGVIDNLVKLSDEMVKGIQTSGSFGQAINNLLGLLSGRVQRQALFGRDTLFASDAVTGTEQDVQRVKTAIAELESAIASGQGNRGAAQARLKDLREELQGLEKSANAAKEAREAAYAAGSRRPAGEGGGRVRLPDAPALPGSGDKSKRDKAAEEALAALRNLIDNRVKVIRDGVDAERDALSFRDQILGLKYQQGNVALRAYFDEQDKIRAEGLEATRRAIAAEIEERQKELKAPGLKPADKVDIEGDIQEARARLAKAEREFGQESERSVIQRQQLVAQLAANVRALDTEIAALSGDRTAQPLFDIAQRVAEARRLLTENLAPGADPQSIEPEVQRYERLLKLQVSLSEARDNFYRIGEQLAISEERIALAQQTGAIGELEALQQVGRARSAVVAQLEEQLRAQEAIAEATKDPDVLLGIERTRLELDKLKSALDPLKEKFDGLFRDSGEDFFKDIAIGKGRDALRGFFDNIANELVQVSSRELSRQLFGAQGPLSGVSGALANLFRTQTPAPQVAAATPGVEQLVDPRTLTQQVTDLFAGLFGGRSPASEAITGLTGAATGSTDVLGKLPSLAAIPATTSIAAMGAAAQIASVALGQLSASATAGAVGGAAGSSGIGLLGLGGLIGGGGGFGTGANFGNMDLGLFLHKGGIAGRDEKPTRYHTGGIAGLMPDEVPAILRRGEEVLTEKDPRHRNNGGGSTVVNAPISLTVNGVPDKATREQVGRQLANEVQMAMNRRTSSGGRSWAR